MSVSQQHELYDDAVTRRVASRARPRTGHAVLLSIWLFFIAAALVYYASQLWLQQQTTQAALVSAKTEVRELKQDKDRRSSKLVSLEQQAKQRGALLTQREAQVLELNTALAAAQTRLDELKEERSEFKEQLAEFRKVTQQFRRMIDSGRLSVTFRHGRMIVELPAQVLFPSGSAELSDDGAKSLAEVARVLRAMPNRRFIVGGHTDNVPVSNEHFANNWELSTARAVRVTAALIRGGLRPQQLVAAGYSEYDPVASNAREAGRQKNRRIEIILEPRLKPVPELESPKKSKDKPAKKT